MQNLFLAFLSALTVETYAQAEYKSLESFNNDTLKYIRYNFEENKQRYIGQAYSKLINEYDITLYYDHISPSSTMGNETLRLASNTSNRGN